MHVDLSRQIKTEHLWPEAGVVQHQSRRNTPGLEDVLLVVDVIEKRVYRPHPLADAGADRLPFVRVEDARDDIERNQPLDTFLAAVDRKRDSRDAGRSGPPADAFPRGGRGRRLAATRCRSSRPYARRRAGRAFRRRVHALSFSVLLAGCWSCPPCAAVKARIMPRLENSGEIQDGPSFRSPMPIRTTADRPGARLRLLISSSEKLICPKFRHTLRLDRRHWRNRERTAAALRR